MTNIPITNNEGLNQLDWSAFCYAAGELSAAEAAEFEARLADDQATREALARAVELTQVVAAAESQVGDVVLPLTAPTAGWSLRLSWMAIGGLAAALLALLWIGALEPSLKTARRARHALDQYELAAAWSQTRSELSNVKAAGLWPSVPSFHGDADDELSSSDASLDAVAVDETPSWMDAAVLGIGGELSDEADGALGRTESLEN